MLVRLGHAQRVQLAATHQRAITPPVGALAAQSPGPCPQTPPCDTVTVLPSGGVALNLWNACNSSLHVLRGDTCGRYAGSQLCPWGLSRGCLVHTLALDNTQRTTARPLQPQLPARGIVLAQCSSHCGNTPLRTMFLDVHRTIQGLPSTMPWLCCSPACPAWDFHAVYIAETEMRYMINQTPQVVRWWPVTGS